MEGEKSATTLSGIRIANVIVVKEKKKYKAKFKNIQRSNHHLTQAVYILHNSLASGIKEYHKRSKESYGEKQNGTTADFLPNAFAGLTEASQNSSKILTQFFKAFESSNIKFITKRFIQFFR